MVTLSKLILSAALVLVTAAANSTLGQSYETGSRNVHEMGHLPLGAMVRADAKAFLVDVRIDQRDSRPYAYVAEQSGWAVVDLSDPAHPSVLSLVPSEYAPDRGSGISAIDYASVGGKELVLVGESDRLRVYDVSKLGSAESPVELAAIEGSFRSLFAYKHSSGASLLIASSGGPASVYSIGDLVDGSASDVAEIPTPAQADSSFGYESVFAAFDGATDEDRFYGAGAGGYHVYNITQLDSVTYLTSANPAAVKRGLDVSPSADGNFLATTADYRTAPVRIFDLTPAEDGRFSTVRTSVGAWANNWRGFHLDVETRWPYVFVAAAEQGLQIFNARDATDPYTIGYFSTSRRPEGTVNDRPETVGGAVAVDIRNSDGLVAVGDQQTGLWLLRLESFTNWDGRGWGYPNISSAQDWANGPSGSTTFD